MRRRHNPRHIALNGGAPISAARLSVTGSGPEVRMSDLLSGTKPFEAPILARSLGQVATSFGGFFITCAAAYVLLGVSVWTTPPLLLIAAGFLVRIFIIQHDCGHGSFLRSRRANNILGSICSLVTLTPYTFWRRQHARHHGSWNNLDRRAASGLDIYSSCMTVAEYRALGPGQRAIVRVLHHPIVANLLLPPLVFIFLYRTPFEQPRDGGASGWPSISRVGGAFRGLGFLPWVRARLGGPAPDHGIGINHRRLAVLRA